MFLERFVDEVLYDEDSSRPLSSVSKRAWKRIKCLLKNVKLFDTVSLLRDLPDWLDCNT